MNARAGAARDIVSIGYGAGSSADVANVGSRAHHLLRMARLGLPVSPAFVLGSGWCREHSPPDGESPRELRASLAASVRSLEIATGLAFGATRKPLLLAVQASAAVPIPGMPDTVLDIGLNDATVPALLRLTGNPRLAWNSYRRLVQSFAAAVHGAPSEPFDALVAHELERHGLDSVWELDFRSLEQLTRADLRLFEERVGRPFPQQPLEQLEAAVAALFRAWTNAKAAAYRALHGVADDRGMAVTVQRMVYGSAGGSSGAGIAFTRDPATGENGLQVEFFPNAQAEDVSWRSAVSDTAGLGVALPDVERELTAAAQRLEREFRDIQEFTFAVQDGRLFLLQTRTAQRTSWAMLRATAEYVVDGLISPCEALARLDGIDLQAVRRARIDTSRDARCLAHGVPASIGVASGPIALDSAVALRLAAAGQPPILVWSGTENEDFPGIVAAAGLMLAGGGRASPAAVLARQMNKACVIACDALNVDPVGRRCAFHGAWLREGDTVTLDGNTGEVYAGVASVTIEPPPAWLAEVARWKREAESSTAGPAR